MVAADRPLKECRREILSTGGQVTYNKTLILVLVLILTEEVKLLPVPAVLGESIACIP